MHSRVGFETACPARLEEANVFTFLRGISGRLFLLTIITLASQVVAAGIIFYYDSQVTNYTEDVVEKAFPLRLASAQMRADENAVLRYTYRAIVDTDAERGKKIHCPCRFNLEGVQRPHSGS